MDENEYVLVPRTQEVKVFLNAANDVVLVRELEEYERQSANSDDREVSVVIPKHYIPALIERLKQLLADAN